MRLTAVVLALSLLATSEVEARRRAVTPRPNPIPGAAAWLRQAAVPFATTEARTPLDDLAPLGAALGNARIVALGEATHGSREFFTMKHRILELLVRDYGFTVFAMEAHMAEADLINDYVMEGKGDPARLLLTMSMWTWNTEEVLDLIHWMREYNLARGDRPALSFRGFDMQRSDTAIATIDAYLKRVDPESAAALSAKLDCFRSYAVFPTGPYRAVPATDRDACAAGLTALHDELAARRETYTARSSAREFETILRYARVVVQSEGAGSGRAPGRDPWMAENAAWLANVLHPDEKIVLWAHNFHVTTEPARRMGTELRPLFPREVMTTVGFLFDRGDFWAYADPTRPKTVHHLEPWRDALYEPLFRATGHPRAFVDLRNVPSADARAVFGSTSSIWRIGGVFNPNAEAMARETTTLTRAFDIVIWIESVTPTRPR